MAHARASQLPLQSEIDAQCSRQVQEVRAAKDNLSRAQFELDQAEQRLVMLDRTGPIQGVDAFAQQKRDLVGRIDALRIKRNQEAQSVTQAERELAAARSNVRDGLLANANRELQMAGQQTQAEVDRAMAEVRRISEANRQKIEALADRVRQLQSLSV